MKPQVISVSRRTDVPAFFTDWWIARVREGYVLVPNPRNPKQVSRVSLAPADVLAVVYWSRDYDRLIPHLEQLEARGLHGIFHLTITPYDQTFEPARIDESKAIEQAEWLAQHFGPRRIIWRYDPIILGSRHDEAFHLQRFERLARRLAGTSSKCVISYLDRYGSTKRGLDSITQQTGEIFPIPDLDTRLELARKLREIGATHGMEVVACCEPDLLPEIPRARCIDPELVALAAGVERVEIPPAPTRKGCGCVYAKDIGAYDTCPRGCIYCYANSSRAAAARGARRVDPKANTLGPVSLQPTWKKGSLPIG